MPLIIVEGPKIDIDTRRKLAQDLTRVASEAFALPEENILVILREVGSDCVSRGGELICDKQAAGE